MIDKTKLQQEAISRLCNIMVNAQELIDDLEFMEEANLYKQNLKQSAKRLLEHCEHSVNNIFGVGYKEVTRAIKDGKTEEEVEEIKSKAEISNREILVIYDAAMKSRKEYRNLNLDERLQVLQIVEELKKTKKKPTRKPRVKKV